MRKLLFFIILIFFTYPINIMGQKKNIIQEAIQSYDYETALKLISKEKPTVSMLYQKGIILKGLGYNSDALKIYQELIKADSINPRAYIEAGECCRLLSANGHALNYYKQAYALDPRNKYIQVQYINLLLSMQMYQEALMETNQLAERDSSATVLHLKAMSYEGLGQLLYSIEQYRLIQDKYQGDCIAAIKLGTLYNEKGNYDNAIKCTEIYRNIDSTNVFVNRQNALAYCLKQNYTTALNRYNYLVSHGDSTLQTLYYMGVCYYAQEHFYEAHDLLVKALEKAPNNINLLYYLGRSCAMTSWKKEGVSYLEKAIELSLPKDSNMIMLYTGLNDCYKMANMPKEQIEAIKECYTKYDNNNPKALYDIATIYYFQLKDTQNAEKYLRSFLSTRIKERKKETDTQSSNATEANYYNVAETWLNDIQTRKKLPSKE